MIKGSDIREARNRAGMSQEELAQAVGVTLRTIGNWERSATAPREKLPILRSILGDHLDDASVQSPRLRSASDLELIDEVKRRLARTEQEEGQADGTPPAKKTDELADRRRRGPARVVDKAARKDTGPKNED